MKRTVFILFFLLTIIFSSCNFCKHRDTSGNKKTKGHISISGAFALYPITVRWAEEFQKEFPGIRIDI